MMLGVIKPTKEQIARAKPFQAIQQKYRTGTSTITDFRNRRTAYFNQKSTLMCKASSMARQAAFDYHREFGTDLQMSPAFIYGYRVKETYQGEGMDVNSMYDFVDNGTVPFSDNPLIADYPTCKKSITQTMIANAKKQKGKEVICFFPNRFGAGGSGGGGRGYSATPGGNGGSDGTNGATATVAGGAGQGHTTREWGEAVGILHGGGGGGSAISAGSGGAGGGGNGSYNGGQGTAGTDGLGGGGGGGYNATYTAKAGGRGLVILRWGYQTR